MNNKIKRNYQYSTSDNAPINLDSHPFYGLNLDEEQKMFRDEIWNPDRIIIMCNAKAGTGKTTVALGTANLLVQYGRYNGIVYIMAPTQEQRQGYLPGSIEDKSAPYMEPLIEAMNTLGIPPCALINDDMSNLKSGDAYIQFTVTTFLRGCNFENKVIILDEFQNQYFDEAKKTLTRMHDSCKVICIGQDTQCDLVKHPERSGFVPYLNAFKDIKDNDNRVGICELNTNHRGWLSTFCDNVKSEF